MKTHRGFTKAAILSILGGALGALFLVVLPVHAQTTVSTFTVNVAGTFTALQTGLAEDIQFSGPVLVTASVVTDPILPPGVVISIDGKGVTGVGLKTGAVFHNGCEANLTRRFGATDALHTTFTFFENKAGSYMFAKSAMLNLNLTYSPTTMSLGNVTASIAAL